MSVVTDVIFTCSLLDDDKPDVVNAWLARDPERKARLVCVHDTKTGGKPIQAIIAIGAFNYFDTDAFVAFLDTIEWNYPQAVKMFVQEEHDDEGFTLRYGPGTRRARRL